ncbi:MAG TPA: diguanylate cyclase [Acidimicrobiia bacterium]
MTAPIIEIVDDSSVVRAILRRHLEEHGYLVVEAEDGAAALQCCRVEHPDAVLLDIEMPGMDGYGVLGELKADPELCDLPVVFLTGRTDTDDVVEGLRLGAHDYLRKPFEVSELIARVSAAVRVKALQDELRRRNGELDRLSRTDALTGLGNRRQVEDRIHDLASLSRRHHQTLAALMFDIDHFKRVNDAHGHAAGDAVLREFGIRLRQELRDEDVPGRWGGEEFVVLLPATDLAGAAAAGERVRASVAAVPFALGNGTTITVTVSCGCAINDGCDPEELVRRADVALYVAKEGGRDRVVATG